MNAILIYSNNIHFLIIFPIYFFVFKTNIDTSVIYKLFHKRIISFNGGVTRATSFLTIFKYFLSPTVTCLSIKPFVSSEFVFISCSFQYSSKNCTNIQLYPILNECSHTAISYDFPQRILHYI